MKGAVESSPTITLEITKGPRNGDSFTYHPNVQPIVRIGRLVRGNTLAIRDSGISSKHLTLQFNPDSGKWVLTDLDSSNGTFLNGSDVGIEPGKGYIVGDGDRVKIGERTDFFCRVSGGGGGVGLRRNPRRKGDLGEGKDGIRVLGEIGNGVGEEDGVLGEKRPAVRRRGQRKDDDVAKEIVEGKGKENSGVVRAGERRKAGRLKEEANLGEREMKQLDDCLGVAVEESKRRRGGRKDGIILTGTVVKSEPLDEPIEVERVEVVEDVHAAARPSTRRTRARTKNVEKSLDKFLEDDGLGHGDDMVVSTKARIGLRSRRKKNGKNARAGEKLERLDVIEEVGDDASDDKVSKDIQNSIHGVEVELPRNLPDENQESGNIDKGKECVDPEVQKGRTGCDSTDIRNGIGSEAKADAMMAEQTPDLSKITVREWLDWLEVNLPKQIVAETEKLIEEMRLKARRVKEYRAEQMMNREAK